VNPSQGETRSLGFASIFLDNLVIVAPGIADIPTCETNLRAKIQLLGNARRPLAQRLPLFAYDSLVGRVIAPAVIAPACAVLLPFDRNPL
jgi:hypothetical protein